MNAAIKVVYKAAPGSRISDSDAVVLGRAIKALGKGVTPARVLTAARAKRSPLHRFFEWNSRVAADAYRLDQARYYLRSVWEVPVAADNRPTGTGARAFYLVEYETAEDGKGRRYFATHELRDIDGAEAQVVTRALTEARAWQARYRRIQHHLAEVFAAIERAAMRLTRKRKKGGRQTG